MSRRGVPIMAGMSSRRWKPAVTVAAVIEQAGRYLLVEERTAAGLQLNTPAGHLEPGESPQAGAVREALEETGRVFTPTALLGVYLAASADAQGAPASWLRLAYCGSAGDADPASRAVLDDENELRFVDQRMIHSRDWVLPDQFLGRDLRTQIA